MGIVSNCLQQAQFFFFNAPVNFYCKGGPGQSVGELEALPGGSLTAVAVG